MNPLKSLLPSFTSLSTLTLLFPFAALANESILPDQPILPDQRILDVSSVAEIEELTHWEPLTFEKIPNQTQYSIQSLSQNKVIQAVSSDSASALVWNGSIDINQTPYMHWCWLVTQGVEQGNAKKKEGDDYAARISVLFEYDADIASWGDRVTFNAYEALYGEYPPMTTLSYFWANTLKQEEHVFSAYTDTLSLTAIRDKSDLHRVESSVKPTTPSSPLFCEKRNLLKDHQNYFGRLPTKLQGVAIMTDTDNTKGQAHAYYGDIWFTKH
ncbi:DUF3047 domain-containing protein [Vibrio sp.]|nr:DUF3047 domain-containing protein [Vibrio sp.]